MVKLRVFLFGSVMHLYWGYPHGKNYASVNNILKVTNFFKNSHFALFSSFVYSPPSDSFDHRNFISCKYMQLYP